MKYDEPIIMGSGNVKEMSFLFEDANFTLLFDSGFVPPQETVYSGELKASHSHTHYELWCFNTETKILFTGETAIFHPGEIAIIPPAVEHVSIQKESSSSRNIIIEFHITHASTSSNFTLYKMLTDMLSKPYFSAVAPKKIYEIIKYFDNYNPSNALSDFLQSSQNFYELIVFLLLTSSAADRAMPTYTLSATNSSRSYKILLMIERYSSKKLTIDKIAETLSLSVRQTERTIEELFGTSFKNLLINKRMKEASILLLTTNMNTREIASRVGYNSPKGFYSIFRKHFGCTPTEYKKKNKRLYATENR